MSREVVSTLAPLLLSGGLVAAVVAAYRAKRTVPAERDSIVVTGAETAVLTLERTLQAETKRADRAEAALTQRDDELARKDRRIAALEARLDQLQVALDQARDELHAIIKGGTDL
jgi:septal ring factor EnvC (AmiA/AmiB activator)